MKLARSTRACAAVVLALAGAPGPAAVAPTMNATRTGAVTATGSETATRAGIGTATGAETATGIGTRTRTIPTEVPSPEFKALRERGIALHDAARDGDEAAAGKAVEQLERYLDRFSNDGEARVCLGSAYAMMGRDASSIANKMRYTNRGLRHLDRARDAAPRMFTVRLIRARVNSSLPAIFGRGAAALEDMLALDEIFREDPSPGLVRAMIDVYEALRDRAPAAGPWAERLDRLRRRSGEFGRSD